MPEGPQPKPYHPIQPRPRPLPGTFPSQFPYLSMTAQSAYSLAGGPMTARTLYLSTLLAASASLVACGFRPTEHGSFDRKLDVSGPLLLQLATPSSAVPIKGPTTSNQVRIHLEATAGSFSCSAADAVHTLLS